MNKTTTIITLLASLIASGCHNTSQRLDNAAIEHGSGTMNSARVDDDSFNVANAVPQNVLSMNSGGIGRTDIATASFAGAATNAGAVALNFAQDAQGEGIVWRCEFGADGYLTSIELSADKYYGSGSAAITASAPIVMQWVDMLKSQSADQQAVSIEAIKSANPILGTLVQGILAGISPTP